MAGSSTRAPFPRFRAVPALLLLSALVFSDSLSGAHELFERDIHTLWRGQMASFVNVVGEGTLPLWNPYLAFGRPMLADPGYQALYPWTWVYLFVPLSYGFALYSWLHVTLCGLGVRKLALITGLSPLGAFGAGCVALLSGPLLSYVNLTFQLAGAAWLPWTLVAALLTWREADRRSVLRMSLTLVLQVFAGSGEMIVAAGTVIVAGAALGCVRSGWFLARRSLAALALAGILGGAVSAVQWMPTLALVRSSNRQVLDEHARGAWALHPARLAEVAIPALLTEAPLRPSARAAYFNGREPVLNSIYLGAAVLGLSLLAVVRGGGLVLASASAAMLFTIVALGPHTLFWPLISAGPFGQFRFPEKWILPASLSLALLCGAGLDAVSAPWSEVQRKRARALLLVSLTCALVVGAAVMTQPGETGWLSVSEGGVDEARGKFLLPMAVLGMIGMVVGMRITRPEFSEAAPVIALALVVGTLLPAARDVNPSTPAAVLSFVPRAARLVDQYGVRRLQARPPGEAMVREMLVRKRQNIEAVAALARLETLSSPASASWGIHGAYDVDVTGLGVPEHSILASATLQFARSPFAERLLRLGAVTHVLAADAEAFPGFEALAEIPWLGDKPLVLLGVPQPRPRILVVHRARSVGSARDAITLLGDPTFDLMAETLLVDGPAMDGTATHSSCEVAHSASDSLDLNCTLGAHGVVVVTDAWDKGWQAQVDGVAVPVLRADVLFRGVEVAAGTHNVRLRYRPEAVTWGALVTLGGALAWTTLALAGRRPRAARRFRSR